MNRNTVALLALLFGYGCGDPPVAPIDTVAPTVRILSPTDPSQYDTDGDRLLDLRILLRDSLGHVDLSTLSVRFIRTITGIRDSTENLAPLFDQVIQSGDTLVLHETRYTGAVGGSSELWVSVRDDSGNEGTDAVLLNLPAGEFLQHIETGLVDGGPALWMTYCEDDHLIYATQEKRVLIFDPEQLEFVSIVDPPGLGSDAGIAGLWQPFCAPNDDRLYLAEGYLAYLYRSTLGWIRNFFERISDARAIVASRLDPARLYISEKYRGKIAVYDRGTHTFAQTLSEDLRTVQSMAVLEGDEKLYAARSDLGGLVTIDPRNDLTLDTIDISPNEAGLGVSLSVELAPDDRFLYVAVLNGTAELLEIDTRTDLITRVLSVGGRGVNVGISPDGTRAFLTMTSNSLNYLIDIPTWSVVAAFAREVGPGPFRWDRDVLFDSSSQLIFVLHDRHIDTYLNRRR